MAGNQALGEVDLLRDASHCSVDYDDTIPLDISVAAIPNVPGAFLLHNILSPAECEQHMRVADGLSWEPSPLRSFQTLNSTRFNTNQKHVRLSERVMLDAPPALADVLNDRISPHLPQRVVCEGREWALVTRGKGKAKDPLNRRWRYNRYGPDGYFKPHYDAGYTYSKDEKTLFTFIAYLNDDFVDGGDGDGGGIDTGGGGGATVFLPDYRAQGHAYRVGLPKPPREVVVKPRQGSALVFFQTGEFSPLHEGRQHQKVGTLKYILRSDVAYMANAAQPDTTKPGPNNGQPQPRTRTEGSRGELEAAEAEGLVGTEEWMRQTGGRVVGGDGGCASVRAVPSRHVDAAVIQRHKTTLLDGDGGGKNGDHDVTDAGL